MELSSENIKIGLEIINKKDKWEFVIDSQYMDGVWTIRNERGSTILLENELHFWTIK